MWQVVLRYQPESLIQLGRQRDWRADVQFWRAGTTEELDRRYLARPSDLPLLREGPRRPAQGQEGLCRADRGGQYSNTPSDTQMPYLKTILSFLGMTDVQFVYAEGLAMGAEAEQNALASARSQIEEAVLV
jgi:hypothetical protein